MTMSALTITHTSTVTEDQIDHLGHMNVRYYAVNARAGTRALLAELDWGDPGDADVFDMYTRHHREQLLGTELEVRSGVLARTPTRSGSTTSSRTPRPASWRRRSSTACARPPVRRSTTSTRSICGRTELPGASTSTASLSAPPLDTVRQLGLAVRTPRTLSRDDTGGTDTVASHIVPMLIWGGTPPDGAEHTLVHTGPNGETVGWATMETRVGIVRLPELGTRIQPFGATTAMADKTTQMAMWAYDLDTCDLLVSFEVVSVLFDIGAPAGDVDPRRPARRTHRRLDPELGSRR